MAKRIAAVTLPEIRPRRSMEMSFNIIKWIILIQISICVAFTIRRALMRYYHGR